MPKCDPRAFARCPYNKTCVHVEKATFTEGSDCDLFNQKVLCTSITNADSISLYSDAGMCGSCLSHLPYRARKLHSAFALAQEGG